VNFSFFLRVATCRLVVCGPTPGTRFPGPVPGACPVGPPPFAPPTSQLVAPALFGFSESDFVRPCVSSSPDAGQDASPRLVQTGIPVSRTRSSTTPGRSGTRDHAPVPIAFDLRNGVSSRSMNL
jgi:hypothetical protein